MNNNTRNTDPFADLIDLNFSATPITSNSGTRDPFAFSPAPQEPSGVALYDYTAQAINQLSFRKGDKIKIKTQGATGGWSEGIAQNGNYLLV
jgi:hypothetical protein